MAETMTETTVETPKVELLTLEQAVERFGVPPDGKRYTRYPKASGEAKYGRIVLGQDGKPVLSDKKKTGGKRNKPSKPTFPVPAGKFRTSETPGFDVSVHARLKQTDFADVLEHAKWEVWYYEQKVAQAKREVDNISKMGSTPEERAAATQQSRLLTAMENMVRKQMAGGNAGVKSAMAERLGALFASLNQG